MNSESTGAIGADSAGSQAVGGSADPELEPTALQAAGSGASPTSEPRAQGGITAGTLLVNTYQVERLLGSGGMGEVYLARHAGLGTEHAIKVIRPSMAAHRQVMDLFYREAKILRGVRHDAVVSYDGFVRDADGRDYLVMEYVDGPSLGERLRQGPLSIQEVLTLRDRLAAGLAEAHRRGAVHRDISPDNVILPGDQVGAAKLIDFGLSKLTDPGEESIIGSDFAGKLRYAAPEQFGVFGGLVDGRSDIYSLGLILAAAAAGRPLDMGRTFEAAVRSRQTVPDLTSVPPPLRPWLTAMLEPDPARRPADLDALLARWPADDRVASAPRPAAGSETTDRQRPGKQAGGQPSRTWLIIGAVLFVAAAAGLYAWLLPIAPLPTPAESVAKTGAGINGQPSSPGMTSASPPTGTKTKPASTVTGSPTASTGVLGGLVEAGRYDEALAMARGLVAARSGAAAGTGPQLPTKDLLGLAEHLRGAGRPQDAFVLAEALIAADAAPTPEFLWGLAQDLKSAGRLDPWFFLVRTLASQGYGPATFAFGEMYDPLHWSAGTSPLAKPRADKAREWYQKAAELGVAGAGARIEALKSVGPGD